MTKTKRIVNILQGLLLVLLALILIVVPVDGIIFVILIVGGGLAIRGIGTLIYYFGMARHMVGGKIMLYRGIITLDLGLFILSLATKQGVYLILCTTAINALGGVFAILKAFESKKIGNRRWLFNLAYGLILIALMIAVIFSWICQNQPTVAVYVYAGGLILSALKKIAGAFKRTAIAYIP